MGDVESINSYLEPVRKSVVVPTSARQSFEIFTARIAEWWPIHQYSISRERAARCALEPRVGGEVYEERDDGARFTWGKVLTWEPPRRFVLGWHPGRPAEAAQEVELRFTETESGTLVELEHRKWARLGDEARRVRDDYAGGWEHVLREAFAGACGGSSVRA